MARPLSIEFEIAFYDVIAWGIGKVKETSAILGLAKHIRDSR